MDQGIMLLQHLINSVMYMVLYGILRTKTEGGIFILENLGEQSIFQQ